MISSGQWLVDFVSDNPRCVDGLIPVEGFQRNASPEVVSIMEKAKAYGAAAVFFEAGRSERPDSAQAFVFISKGPEEDADFAEVHRKLWSWGGVPLVYRVQPGLLQLFRCAHGADFLAADGTQICRPFKVLKVASRISDDPWWREDLLRNGTLWDNPNVCSRLLSAEAAAHHSLFDEIRGLYDILNEKQLLPAHLRRKLLILSLMIAYLEERKVLLPEYFDSFLSGAEHFFEVLADGPALVKLLDALEERFNGNLFAVKDEDKERLRYSNGQLQRFARFVEGRQEAGGQLTMWKRFSFEDLPVELISQIYQLFVKEPGTAVYTPPFLVRLMLDEALNSARLARLGENDEVILDPSCGSCVFLVEAYKRLVLHWRSKNEWREPQPEVLRKLLTKVHGVDVDEGAVELGAFSLCLALCDALKPETIRASYKLFPVLAGKSLHHSCFFEARENHLLSGRVGVVIGNPPFQSEFKTDGGKRAYKRFLEAGHSLPDKQVAYLFLHEAMDCLRAGGTLCLLQQYNLLYNQQSLEFRRSFFKRWDVREILDFISVRGLFQSGGADTKVVVVVAEASTPPDKRQILHATFRRTGRAEAEQGFDIDYYDLHWMPRRLVLENDGVWRANLLGGGRVLAFADRLRKFPTLGKYAAERGWDYGEGFIEGAAGVSRPASHITGKKLLPSGALSTKGVDEGAIITMPQKPIEGPRSSKRFTPPMVLVSERMDLAHVLWTKHYLTYKSEIVGFCGPESDLRELGALDRWLTQQEAPLRAFVAATSVRLFTRKATSLAGFDIESLPYPEERTLDLSKNEETIVRDVCDYLGELVRLGQKSMAMKMPAGKALPEFTHVYAQQINSIYKKNKINALEARSWPGVVCQPFSFGRGRVDWRDADDLKGRLDGILKDSGRPSLHITRITRVYDGNFVFLLKPDRLRFWLRSVALRDADETLADLRTQGF
jgi:N-6 DNA Methylase